MRRTVDEEGLSRRGRQFDEEGTDEEAFDDEERPKVEPWCC